MFTDFWGGTKKPVQWNPIYKLLNKYYDLELDQSPDILLYSCFGVEYLKYDCIRIQVIGENVRPNFSECDYAFSFDYPTDVRNYRLPLYRLYEGYQDLFIPRNPDKILTQNRNFCGFLVSNEVPGERKKLFDLLEKYKSIDSGGKFRNNIGAPVPRGQELDWLAKYKFSFAFENSSYPGYTSEKLLNALVSNTIPIYWGNPLVGKDFNTKAFINCHDFDSFEDVVELITRIDQDDDKYRAILSQPFLPDGVEIENNKEVNIIERFNQIISNHMVYVPAGKKRVQKIKYPILKAKKYFYKRIRPAIKRILVNQG